MCCLFIVVNDRLLSVVKECNTELEDPSRLTGHEDSDNAFSQFHADERLSSLTNRYSHAVGVAARDGLNPLAS